MKKVRLRKAAFAMGVAASVAALITFALGTTTALFSDSEAGADNTFNSGTVTVAPGSSASAVCTITELMPGDSSTNFVGAGALGNGNNELTPCDFKVKYTGSASAWLAVDVVITGGTTTLYTGTDGGFQSLIGVDNGVNIVNVVNGITYKNAAGVDTTLSSGVAATDILVNATPAVTNEAFTFDIDYALPIAAANALQGGSVTVKLTFHAVQSANQPINGCVEGQRCTGITWG